MRTSILVVAGLLVGQTAFAGTQSYTGTLASPEDEAIFTITLTSDGVLGLQTWGFGGGTNGAGQVISPGGFDPFVGVFSGTGDSAAFIDGTSDVLSNYGGGCPPAGTVSTDGQLTCLLRVTSTGEAISTSRSVSSRRARCCSEWLAR